MKDKKKLLGIDASNLRGGGHTYISELLKASKPDINKFDKIIIWGSKKTLDDIVDRDWIIKKTHPLLDRGYLLRAWWQWKKLSKNLLNEKCSILFTPGGFSLSKFNPVVNMSQNMAPFDWIELRRHGFSLQTLRLIVLRVLHSMSFKKADGIIFLTKKAKDKILSIIKIKEKNCSIISHGIDKRFFCEPRKQKNISNYDFSNPFKLIYISSLEPYKHHQNVVKAVCKLRENNIPVSLDMYGPSKESERKKLNKIINSCQFARININYHGLAKHDNIQKLYFNADASIFASSCENLPIILLESMASGLPIACSSIEPMPNVLKNAGIYFDPLDVKSIYNGLLMLINDTSLREINSFKSYNLAKMYSWEKCTNETFDYLNKIVILNDKKTLSKKV